MGKVPGLSVIRAWLTGTINNNRYFRAWPIKKQEINNMNIFKISFTGFLTLSTVFSASDAYAKPGTQANCEASFNKGISGFLAMSDEKLVCFIDNKLCENLKNACAEGDRECRAEIKKTNKATADAIRNGYHPNRDEARQLCGVLKVFPQRVMETNSFLKRYVKMGVLTENDLLEERKSEL
jgi:hypothetical protein